MRIEQFEFANADLAGSATGTWRASAQGPGEIDLVAQLSRAAPGADRTATCRRRSTTPRATGCARRSPSGAVADARLKLAGNLAEFPFADGKGGQFVATAKATGGDARLRARLAAASRGSTRRYALDGTRLRVDGARGQLFGVDLGKTRAEIQDVTAAVPLLTVDGEATGPAAGFLRFVNESPVGGADGQAHSRAWKHPATASSR